MFKTVAKYTFLITITLLLFTTLKFIGDFYMINFNATDIDKYDIVSPRAVKLHFNNNSFSVVNEGQVCNSFNCTEALIVAGKVNYAMAYMIKRTLQDPDFDKSTPLCFISAGGHNKSMIEIIKLMQDHDAIACLGDRYFVNEELISNHTIDINRNSVSGTLCMSACSYIYAGANHRVSYGTPLIGVHKTNFGYFYEWLYGDDIDDYNESSFKKSILSLEPL